jgi:hypothetical protein
VIGTTTGRIVTLVTHNKSVDVVPVEFHDDPVDSFRAPAHTNATISIFVALALPFPALPTGVNVVPESFF